MMDITTQRQQRKPANRNQKVRSAGIIRFAYGLLTTAAFFMSVALISTFLARWGWLFEMTSHFRLHIIIGLLSIALLFMWGRQWPLAGMVGLVGAIGLASLLPFYLGSPSVSASHSETTYRALAFNVYYHSEAYDDLLAFIAESDPDIIVLSEVTKEWYHGVQSLAVDYPYSRYITVGSHGRLLYSRLPFVDEGPERVKDWERPSVVAALDLGTAQINVIGVHVRAPMSPASAQQRNRQMADLAQFVQAQPEPTLLLGDFNITPWSPVFKDFLAEGGLKDGRMGHGLAATWPTHLPVLGIPIDHAVASAGIAIHNFQRGPHLGSDHYPIIVDFTVK